MNNYNHYKTGDIVLVAHGPNRAWYQAIIVVVGMDIDGFFYRIRWLGWPGYPEEVISGVDVLEVGRHHRRGGAPGGHSGGPARGGVGPTDFAEAA